MAITGRLSDFSLGEIFKLLEQGQKTGLLTIRAAHSPADALQNFYLWFNTGQLVAAANRLDYKGLATLIHQRDWLGDASKTALVDAFKSDRPLGLHLKCQGLLTAEQLKLLFYTQVMRQMCAIFRFPDGWFNFETKTTLPLAEMTGLVAVPTEVTLEGLRALKDWKALSNKLPEPNSAITALAKGKPSLKINALEWQVWEYANGTEPLTVIAEQLKLPLEKVQQVAFRLMVVGLLEEVPCVISSSPSISELELPNSELGADSSKPVSSSFLHNLASFLNSRVGQPLIS